MSLSVLPAELKKMIIEYLNPESKDTLRMSTTNRVFRDIALARYWSVIKRDESLYKLLNESSNVQQTYVNLIKQLTISGKDWETGMLDHLRFNSLEKLVITQHDENNAGNLLEDISNFIGPRLVHLELHENQQYDVAEDHLKVKNFFPILNRAAGLKYLDLGCQIEATPKDLLHALQACTELEEVLIQHGAVLCFGSVIDPELSRYAATNRKIRTWFYDIEYTEQSVIKALRGIPKDQEGIFLGLSQLCISITSAAAKHLFPRLHSVTALNLFLVDKGDLLQTVANMQQLDALRIEHVMANSSLHTISLQYLAPLQLMSLKKFTLAQNEWTALRAPNVDVKDLAFMFGSHITLESLEFAWAPHMTFFENDVGTALAILARAYPNLKTLTMPEASMDLPVFTVKPGGEMMWPSLERLKVDEVQEPDDPSM